MDPLRALVERLDTNDPATAAHGRAVAHWCSRIAAQLRLPRDEHTWIVRSAQLHDIGKLCIPDEILRAPRALRPAELLLVAQHVIEGERLLAEYDLLEYRDAVRHHHERFDGRGYPDGLRAETIPLAARIVAVADAYDAMTGQRPYRFPMTPDRALLEIERCRGSQFDPGLVEVMLAVVGDALRPVAV
ncbi:MAG TPA: HD domain-containing phosphohydrolase [Candidatus Elarobacter sp.]|jgi:HD-GYP domain-containing protein (c-di-GMP phosphodiesterase class II)